MKSMLVGFALLLSLLAFNAFAAPDQNYGGHFGDMDTNSDKKVTWDEFKPFSVMHKKLNFKKRTSTRTERSITANGTNSRKSMGTGTNSSKTDALDSNLQSLFSVVDFLRR